jgi:hypothetical protein
MTDPVAHSVVNFVAKKLVADGVRAFFGPSPDDVFREVQQKAHADTSGIAYMVARALLAHQIGKDPLDSEMDQFLASAVDDPGFYPRFTRLIGEATKSSSTERRRLLAVAFFSIPKLQHDDDDKQRMDAAFERMFPGDAAALGDLWRVHQEIEEAGNGYLCLCSSGKNDRTAGKIIPSQLIHDDGVQGFDIDISAYPKLPDYALANLEGIGCIRAHTPTRVKRALYTGALIAKDASETTMTILNTARIDITRLGRQMAEFLDDPTVRAGLGAS